MPTVHPTILTTCTGIKTALDLQSKSLIFVFHITDVVDSVSLCLYLVNSYLGPPDSPRVGLCLGPSATRQFASPSVSRRVLSLVCFSPFPASVCFLSLHLSARLFPSLQISVCLLTFSYLSNSVSRFISRSHSLSSFPASVCFSSLHVSALPFLVASLLGLFLVSSYLDLSASHSLIFT